MGLTEREKSSLDNLAKRFVQEDKVSHKEILYTISELTIKGQHTSLSIVLDNLYNRMENAGLSKEKSTAVIQKMCNTADTYTHLQTKRAEGIIMQKRPGPAYEFFTKAYKSPS